MNWYEFIEKMREAGWIAHFVIPFSGITGLSWHITKFVHGETGKVIDMKDQRCIDLIQMCMEINQLPSKGETP